MARDCRTSLLLGTLIFMVGCDPNIEKDEPVEGTSALFDPVTGQLPLPNDALSNPATGLLEVPPEPGDSELTLQIKEGLSMINGWIPGSIITIPFDGELDPSTLNGNSVRLYDVTESPSFERVAPDDYAIAFNVGRDPATEPPYTLFVRQKPPAPFTSPPDFKMGHLYIVVVTHAIRDIHGEAVLGTPVMELLKSRTPLVNEFGRSNTILPDAAAAGLEALRAASYAPAFDALEASAEVSREEIVAHAAFTIQSNPMPAFNPMAIGNELPKPIGEPSTNNAKFDKPWACFHHPIEAQTAPAGAKMYKRETALSEVDVTVSVGPVVDPDDTGKQLCEQAVILDAGALEASTTYQVVLTDAIEGLDGAPSRQSSIFSLVAKTTPLLDISTEPPSLNSPLIDSTLDALMMTGTDPSTATPAEWEEAYETLVGPLALGNVEDWRREYQGYLEDAVAAGTAREDITVTWVFTTAAE